MYIVLDLEFNQPFDFINNTKGVPDKRCPFEIIQIGAVKLDDNFNKLDSFNMLIKPQIYKKMHPHVQKITGFTDDSFENCRTFSEVYSDFAKFMANSQNAAPILCTWGNSDISALYKNLKYYSVIKSPIIIKYVDVQDIATKYLNYKKGGAIGLKNAVDMLGIKTSEFYHNAYYDALYTAEVFRIVKSEKISLKIFNSKRIK